MLNFEVLTLFPEIFSSFLKESLIKKAIMANYLQVDLINFRNQGYGKHLSVDGPPYGGGPGMLLRIEPIARTIEMQKRYHRVNGCQTHSILITPQGEAFTQAKAEELSQRKEVLTLICGRYEGFDERIRYLVDEEISGGDFICLGGEIISMMIIEAVSRLIPNVLGNKKSVEQESFSCPILEYPQYTRPLSFQGMNVPEELISGDHKKIEEWRAKQAVKRTKIRRPDML